MRRPVKHITIILISLLFSCETRNSFNPPDENYFLKYFGNAGNQEGIDFVVNPDGTFVLLGNSRATPLADQQVYVAKADSKGNIVWEKTFGGKYDEEAKDIELLPDGNLIVLANSANNASNDPAIRERDVMLIKLGQDGSKMDSVKQNQGLRKIDNLTKGDEDAKSLTILLDGGFIVAGSTTAVLANPTKPTDLSDAIHLRFNPDLTWVDDATTSWVSRRGYAGEDVAIKVIQYNANEFYVMGYSNIDKQSQSTVIDFNFWISGLTGSGTGFFGSPIFAGSVSFDEKLTSVTRIPAQSGSGYLLTGSSQNTTQGGVHMLTMTEKLSLLPAPIGKNYPDFLGDQRLSLNLVKPNPMSSASLFSSSNGFYLTSEKLNGSTSDIVLYKMSSSGADTLLERIFGGVGDDFAGPVVELPDGHIVMIGTFTLGGVVDGQKKIVFMKLNKEGRLAP